MNICIYGASSAELKKIYYEKTEELGQLMGKRGHGLVFGGGKEGLMGAAARGVDREKGYILGIAPRFFDQPQHPFSLCKRKIKHIGQIAMLAGSEGFMLEEIVTDTRTYKFGTTDLNFTLCLNKEYDDQGQQKGDCFVVESLRDEDCFSKSTTAYTVTHIFSAPNDAKKYTTLLFLDENAMIDSLPDEIKNMLDQTLLHK